MYNTLTVTDNITFDKIISIIDEYHIYSHYIGKQVKLNSPISSPFRKDNNPSWSLFISKRNEIMYKDFATGETGNVIKFVQTMFSLTYHKALEKIWNDIIVGGKIKERTPRIETIQKEPSKVIGIKRKNFTKRDDDYWEVRYNIDRSTLKKFNVCPIECFFVNGIMKPYIYTSDCPMYAYRIFNKFKIYRPFASNKLDKWRTNCGMYDIQGWEQLPDKGDLVIITKSLKDVMVLYKLGYNAIAPQSENSIVPKKVIDNLKTRFKEIIIFFDNDSTGLEMADKLAYKYDLKYIYIPLSLYEIYQAKDISDIVYNIDLKYADEKMKEMLNEKKESYKQESS
jgi:5S rRNA maturation endonuclease (ribonuclease M5)